MRLWQDYSPRRVSLASRERAYRREQRTLAKARGIAYPHLKTIGHITVPSGVPEWACAWAIPGLTLTETTIWLGKKWARKFMKIAAKDGIEAYVVYTPCRRCQICQRLLLGIEAEHRWNLDRKWEGSRIPCSPECTQLQWDRIENRRPTRIAQISHEGERRPRGKRQMPLLEN